MADSLAEALLKSLKKKEYDARFSTLMPGYDINKALRTPDGYPYVEEVGDMEAGTFGQRLEGKPVIRLSPRAKPMDKLHEIEHIRQLYNGGVGDMDKGYDMAKNRSLYMTSGLTPDEAEEAARLGLPSEVAARRASGDPDTVYQQYMQRVNAILEARKKRVK